MQPAGQSLLAKGGLLYGVAPADPASLAASLLPARRATRVDPIETLRAE